MTTFQNSNLKLPLYVTVKATPNLYMTTDYYFYGTELQKTMIQVWFL